MNIGYLSFFIQEHYKECQKYQVECPHGCGAKMQRGKVNYDMYAFFDHSGVALAIFYLQWGYTVMCFDSSVLFTICRCLFFNLFFNLVISGKMNSAQHSSNNGKIKLPKKP